MLNTSIILVHLKSFPNISLLFSIQLSKCKWKRNSSKQQQQQSEGQSVLSTPGSIFSVLWHPLLLKIWSAVHSFSKRFDLTQQESAAFFWMLRALKSDICGDMFCIVGQILLMWQYRISSSIFTKYFFRKGSYFLTSLESHIAFSVH